MEPAGFYVRRRMRGAMITRMDGLRGSAWRVHVPLAFGLGIVAVLAFLVFRPFLLTFVVAGSVALLLAPLQRRLTRRLGRRPGAAAALLVLLCTVVLLVPVLTYGTLITQQAIAFIAWLRPQLEPHALDRLWTITLPDRYPLLAHWLREAMGGQGVP